ncbi:unnamed protein product [Ceratitis capitata]|uniref:(Mediterranean fruit fly) hypothetical protein n=1 Tax=Ceratitis capitata TaxID=7213 RepID=A0A811UPA8_CERCA|nr:unnamed protein product [Ceratitis capitata]
MTVTQRAATTSTNSSSRKRNDKTSNQLTDSVTHWLGILHHSADRLQLPHKRHCCLFTYIHKHISSQLQRRITSHLYILPFERALAEQQQLSSSKTNTKTTNKNNE